jgi:GDP-4-dehydro-6-deoxy-D-mannose reductase
VTESLLVTGAGGFVGSHVVERARQRGMAVATTRGDLREPDCAREAVAEARPTGVVHLAARGRGGGEGAWEVLADELRMAGNVLSAVSELAPETLVLVPGSAGQYGAGAPEPLREDAPLAPLSPYGATKCVLEAACTAGPLRGRARVVWARSFNLVGPGQGLDAPIPAWAHQIARAELSGGGAVRAGELSVVRDVLDVRDAADAYLDLLAAGAQGAVNVGSGVPVTLRDVMSTLTELAQVPVEVALDEGLRRAVDPPVVVADTTRLRELTGWEPRISLRDSLRDVIEEWRARARVEDPALEA